jgi:DNA adenine methylase
VSGSFSPLRYPGGKQVLFSALRQLIELNGLSDDTYVEPYAGGAGAALALLYGEHVSRLKLNDADPAIYAFWKSALSETEAFLKLLQETPLTIDEWKRQRRIYSAAKIASPLELGFATFYLNRCNRSGIIANAGVIGGLEQLGKWKIDARFNRKELARRISRLALYKDRIEVYNQDAIQFLESEINTPERQKQSFVYLDPPYYLKGSQLYLSYYSNDDHGILAQYLKKKARFSWVLTYDDAAEIRVLYSRLRIIPFNLRYSASASRAGSEVLISRKGLTYPDSLLDDLSARSLGKSG